MNILALDTATEACSAAVWLVDKVAAVRYQNAPRRHAALIMPMIEAVLAETGLTVRQLDAIAFGRGPGAFTGVRIAAGVAQGLAFAADLPVIPVSTLATVALGAARASGQTQIAVALDARMGEVYWGTYAITADANDAESVGEEQVCAPSAVTAPPGLWLGAGSGWAVYAATLAEAIAVSGWSADALPHATDVAVLAAAAAQRRAWVCAEQALPVYLRNTVAVKSAPAAQTVDHLGTWKPGPTGLG